MKKFEINPSWTFDIEVDDGYVSLNEDDVAVFEYDDMCIVFRRKFESITQMYVVSHDELEPLLTSLTTKYNKIKRYA